MEHAFNEPEKGRKARGRKRKNQDEVEISFPKRRTRASKMAVAYSTTAEDPKLNTTYGMSHDTPNRRRQTSTISEYMPSSHSTTIDVSSEPASYTTSQATQPAPEEKQYSEQYIQRAVFQTVTREALEVIQSQNTQRYSQAQLAVCQNTSKRRTRASTMSVKYSTISIVPQMSTVSSYTMSQTAQAASEVAQSQNTQYHSQAQNNNMSVYQTPTQSAENPHTSSDYYQTRLQRVSSSHPMSEKEASSGYATRAQLPGISDMFHAMADCYQYECRRTRAAIRKKQDDSGYTPRQDMPNMSVYSMPERAATELPNTSTASVRMQLPNLCVSNAPNQSSGRGYNTPAVHNLPISTAPTYWTTNTLADRNINFHTKKTRTRYVQTDISITEDEAKLLKLLKVKQMYIENIHITVSKRKYTVTYVEPHEKEVSPKALHSIVRSSDLIKTSLMKFYNNSLQQGNASTIPTQFHNNPDKYFDNDKKFQASTPPLISNFSQNVHHEEQPETKILEELLNETNSAYNRKPRYNTPEIRQTKTTEQYFTIPTVSGNRNFSNHNNTSYTQQPLRSHSPQPCPQLGRNFSSDFLRYAPFMNSQFLPQAVRQAFNQYGMPGWF